MVSNFGTERIVGSSGETPLSVSFRSLMGCRVFVAFAPSRIDRKEHFIFGTEQRMDAASKGGRGFGTSQLHEMIPEIAKLSVTSKIPTNAAERRSNVSDNEIPEISTRLIA